MSPVCACNLGLEAAVGNLITFLAHDNLLPTGRINAHCRELEPHGAAAVRGKTRYVHEDKTQASHSYFPGNQQAPTCFSEDQDFRLPLADTGRDIPLCQVHETDMTRGVSTHGQDLLQVLHASILGRRAVGSSTI